MTDRRETAETNAKFFPADTLWAKHCAKVADYLNSVPAMRSGGSWDSRDDKHDDYLEAKS